MALSFRFRENLLGPWESAKGFLIAELDYLFADLGAFSGGSQTFGQNLTTGAITDTVNTGIVANYNPAGLDSAAQVRISGGAATQLTGMQAPATGAYKLLVNVGTTAMSLLHRHTSSDLRNQFVCPGGVTYAWPTTTAVWVWYDPIALGWQIIGK